MSRRGVEIVSDPWDESSLGLSAEFVEDIGSFRDRGKQPVRAALVDTLRKEGDDS